LGLGVSLNLILESLPESVEKLGFFGISRGEINGRDMEQTDVRNWAAYLWEQKMFVTEVVGETKRLSSFSANIPSVRPIRIRQHTVHCVLK